MEDLDKALKQTATVLAAGAQRITDDMVGFRGYSSGTVVLTGTEILHSIDWKLRGVCGQSENIMFEALEPHGVAGGNCE